MELRPLDEFNMPAIIKRGLREKGIEYLTPPQVLALNRGLLNGKNLVVVAPTASGKTLVGELALVHAGFNRRMGLYATPLKALAMEKYEEFKFWEKYGLRVGISTSDFDEPGEALGKYDIVVATYERLDSILRHKPSWLSRVSVIVIDELHTIGDPDRGPIVELIATRALHLGKQVIGLSATVGNPERLAKWLSAELVSCDWRPVRLIEGYYDKFRREIVFEDGRVEELEAPDLPSHIAIRAMKDDYQALIFKQARRQAEQIAMKVSKIVERHLDSIEVKELRNLASKLRERTSSRLEYENLSKLIERGVAYHHAGLSLGARRIVEEGFRSRLIKIVVATPTLAAGINLPARRVVIYTKRFEEGRLRPISIAEYKQMAGRAGRPQYDPYGEAIIADATPGSAEKYIRSSPEPVTSKLWCERALRIHVLATIASGYARTVDELVDFFGKTYGAFSFQYIFAKQIVRKVIEALSSMDMVKCIGERVVATKLGEIVSKLYIDPKTASIVISALKRFEKRLPDLYYLHTIASTPDFSRVRVLGYRALELDAISMAREGIIPTCEELGIDFEEWLRAFKIAQVLQGWIEELDEDTIVERFGIGLGDLATLIDTATWLLHASSVVCSVLGLEVHANRLAILTERVEHGVKEDLLELVKVRGIGRVRARILASIGIRTIEDLLKVPRSRLISLPSFGEKVVDMILESARNLAKSKLIR